ncbi:hypothetical protein ACE38V_15660 [Cytobacillus sp. Hz8]|uniref:hypothetical protein n=1 Tax=Cytobacillus sp. Hz8 TaxID=3347168 RepID=UPI0035DBBDA7
MDYEKNVLADGGNFICCIAAKDMVVTITSKFMMNPKNRLTLIKEYIIPAVK